MILALFALDLLQMCKKRTGLTKFDKMTQDVGLPLFLLEKEIVIR
jgi:hypothetical protein